MEFKHFPLLARLMASGGHVSSTGTKPTRPTKAKPKKGRGKTLYVGDSLGVGTTPYLRGVRKDVKGGRTSTEGAQIIRRNAKGAGQIVFDLGTNDTSAKELKRSVRQAVRAAKGKPVFALEIQGGSNVRAKNRVLRQSGAKVLDTTDAGVAPDRIHASNYKRRAKTVKRAIKK